MKNFFFKEYREVLAILAVVAVVMTTLSSVFYLITGKATLVYLSIGGALGLLGMSAAAWLREQRERSRAEKAGK